MRERGGAVIAALTPRSGALSLAGGDGAQEVVVLGDAGEETRQPIDHQVPDPDRQVEVAAERLLQVGVGGAPVAEAGNARIEPHQRFEVVATGAEVGVFIGGLQSETRRIPLIYESSISEF